MLKKIICMASAAAVAVSLAACGAEKKAEIHEITVPEVMGEFKTTVLDIGKADAIILETAAHTVVIDTGEKDDGDEVVEYLTAHGIESIDYLFITHFDKDHVGGAPEVMANIAIGEIITPAYEGNNNEYGKFIDALEVSGKSATALTEYMSFTLDDAVFEVYPPEKASYTEEDNDFSIVINVTHGDNTFMFAGDCETERLSELSGQMSMEHAFLKIPHHGIYCDGMDELISSVAPRYAVITDSEKNPADEEMIDLLEAAGCEIYETIYGTITAVSDGAKIDITQGE